MVGSLQKASDHVVTRAESVISRYDAVVRRLEERMTDTQQRLFEVFRFLAAFAVLALPFYVVLDSGWSAPALRTVNAAVSTQILSVLGISVTNSGSFIYGEQLVLDVTRDSTGWKSMVAFVALVLASRRPLRHTFTGIVAGVAVLFVANIVRITSMFYAVSVYNVPYEVLHTVLWRWGLTVVVLVTWLAWLNRWHTQLRGWPRILRMVRDRY